MAQVLVVEDCEYVRTALEWAMRRFHHVVTSAVEPEQALSMMRAARPDLVVLDFRMPRMTGATLLREMRDMFGDRTPPAIMISAASEDEVRAATHEANADAYLKKPFELDDLRSATEQALSSTIQRSRMSATLPTETT